MPYKFIEEIAVADIAFEVEEPTLPKLFASAAMAVEESMVDLKSMRMEQTKTIHLTNKDVSKLLFSFLEELVFLKDADCFLAKKIGVKITGKYELTAILYGDVIDASHQQLHNDVKAVTMHKFRVENSGKVWKAFVILDI